MHASPSLNNEINVTPMIDVLLVLLIIFMAALPSMRAVYDDRPDKVLFVKGSAHVRYASVMDAMDVARGAGVEVIGLP